MDANWPHDIRPLSAEELDVISGGQGIAAEFHYGNLHVNIYADSTSYTVCTTRGDQSTCRTHI